MTVRDLASLGLRRWYVFALGLLCAITGSFALAGEPWTYVASTELVMTPPPNSVDFIVPVNARDALISFADVVSRKFNDEEVTHALSSPSATLFGNGVRRGSSVKLLDSGTQWQAAFIGPVISVQVIGSTDAAVQEELDNITLKVQKITKTVQDERGVIANFQITAETDSTGAIISAFGPTKTSKLKGALLLVGFALCISTLVARSMDNWNAHKVRHHPLASSNPLAGAPVNLDRQGGTAQ